MYMCRQPGCLIASFVWKPVQLFSGDHVGVPRRYTWHYGGSVKLCETWEKCLLYLSSVRSHFLNFVHRMVFG